MFFKQKLKKLLKKNLKASTLIETIVASVIIVVIFGIASSTSVNVFKSSLKNNSVTIENQLYQLQYIYLHNKIKLPYTKDTKKWKISVQKQTQNNIEFIEFTGTHFKTKKTIKKLLLNVDH